MRDNRLFELIASDLVQVEERLKQGINSDSKLISEISAYVLGAGGKRLRSALVLLAARLCGYQDGGQHIKLASLVEYLHAATLIHDDIIDNADKRRGKPSANCQWGSGISVLVGDYLFSRSVQMLIEDRDFEVMKAFADATVSMTEGEVMELEMQRNADITHEEYFRIITAKTAALISAACRAGALVARATQEKVEALAAFGLNLGIAFQLVDDALDFVAEEERLGKPVGNDLKEGKITYPLIYVLNHGAEEDRRHLRALATRETLSAEDLEEVRGLVKKYRAVEATLEVVRSYLEQAKANLHVFPESPVRLTLEAIAEFVVERDR
ncbi:MAG: polyprenyl synthetase family protein [candidate division NC10 bacterium]|nr:polyprenyl synthetase family protein [candidate division NC10 bacterium]